MDYTFTVNVPKFVLLVIGMLCITVLIAINSIPAEAGLPILSIIITYATTNGVNTAKGQPTTTPFEVGPPKAK